jgi:DNA-binding protein H-NS
VNLLINLALLTLGFLGTLAAFGGETWKKGSEPLSHRITKRGWVSIACLSCTLLLGVSKEVRNVGENNELLAQVTSLHQQLQQQRSLLAAKRLDEIREQDGKIAEFNERISAIHMAYERFRSAPVAVSGRAQRKDEPPPFKIAFTYASNNFRLGVCDKSFGTTAKIALDEKNCFNSKLPQSLKALPTASFEQSIEGPSIIALIQYLAEISLAHRDVLNEPFTVAKKMTPELTLATLLSNTPVECGISSKLVSSTISGATVLRRIEETFQQLNWLFVYGFPKNKSDRPNKSDNLKTYLDDQLNGTSAETLVLMSQLAIAVGSRTAEQNDETYKLGHLVENIAVGYQNLTNVLPELLARCTDRRKQLANEKTEIENSLKVAIAR